MPTQTAWLRTILLTACLALAGAAGAADPPARVARLGYTSGAVSFSPAGDNEWVQAALNRPLYAGDRLWTEPRARAEIQLGGSVLRAGPQTSLVVLNIDDRIAQVQLTQGTLSIRARRFDRDQALEIDTPNLAFTIRSAGEFRIEVDPEGRSTTILVRSGRGEAYGEGASYVIDSRQPYRFTGTGLREYQYLDPPRFDEFDRWSSERDRRYDASASARYVSPEVVGYEDLDGNGDWRVDATYGRVWFPARVAADWAPYRDGHWAWIDPWGWTWMDDAPWGYAVSHYGRWTHLSGRWGWVPGPVRTRAYYAPALVAFVGGGIQLSISGANAGGIAWFPLGPREVYRPAYRVSRGYFENVNRSNTIVTTVVVNNYYANAKVPEPAYANRLVAGGVIAVPATAFAQSQPVARSAVRLSADVLSREPVAFVPLVAPTERSARGATGQGDKPPARVFERPVIARTAPAPFAPGLAAQRERLSAQPGKPLDADARKGLKPAGAAPAPVVNVVSREQQAAPAPTRLPPSLAAPGKGSEGRGSFSERTTSPTTANPATTTLAPPQAPRAAPPVAPAVPAAPAASAASAAKPPQERARTQPRAVDREDSRAQSAVIPGKAAPAPAPAPSSASMAPPRPPAEKPPEPRPKPGQDDRAATRGQPGKSAPQSRESAPNPPAAPAAAPMPPPVQARPPVVAPFVPPSQASPPIVAPVAPPAQARPPVVAPVAPPAQARPPVVAPAPPAPQPAAPQAQPKGREDKPDAGKSGERKKDKDKDKDEPKPEDGTRKQKD